MKSIRIAIVTSGTLLLLLATNTNAEDWARQSFDVQGLKKASLAFEYPLSWGKKPKYKTFDNVTDISFGPYGPKSKTFFLVHLQSVPTVEVITAEQLQKIAESDVRLLAEEAFESEIPINEMQGPNNRILYYSITDKEKKWGEFDYLTKAVVASGALLTNVYFFSSDGAPDFGSDAMRMMESITFTPPPAEKKDE